MNWIIPTEDDLKATLAAPLVKTLKTAALAKNQTDPIALYMGESVAMIRMSIIAATLPVSATDGTIPPSLLRECAWLTLESAAARLPGMSLSGLQKGKIDEAKSTLRKVAAKSLPIELPDDPVYPQTQTSTSAKSMRLVSSRSDRLSGESFRSL